jgi:hypothetical protein
MEVRPVGAADEGAMHRFPSLLIMLAAFLAVLGGGCSYLITGDFWLTLAAACRLLVGSVWLMVRLSRV